MLTKTTHDRHFVAEEINERLPRFIERVNVVRSRRAKCFDRLKIKLML